MRRLISIVVVLGLIGAAAFWYLTRPQTLPEDTFAGLTPDLVNGEQVFWAAGCASCHSAPEATGEDKLKLGGGRMFESPFGTFSAPNISPDPQQGIGAWTTLQLANALMKGVSPQGRHLYPALPYTSYAHAKPQDILDLRAFLDTLPPVATPSQPHDIPFPFNIRRLVGGWKLMFADPGWVISGELTDEQTRGRYLAEALGHCGQCHTPRNFLGGLQRPLWLSGAPNPEGKGRVPNITPGALTWSLSDIAYYLKSGFTPEFDSAGGIMASVVDNMSHLSDADRNAIAAYLKIVPPVK
ncbi:MAG: cytochrome c [Paracoccaceae bacterium]